MTNQIIFFNDLPFLFSSAELIYFDKIIVKNENGENVAFEKVIEIATNVKNFHESGFKAKILNQFLNFLNKLEHIFLALNEDFDLDEFYSFMKKNKNIKIFARFVDPMSEAYKARLELIIDEILATKEFIYKPPMIEFNGLDREKYEKLREIRNCYKRLY
uniref:Uncharacterized protein n=1 Tax=Panagrolaimus davidi TaxID=227884 RepID=A0A914Q962_9BILA